MIEMSSMDQLRWFVTSESTIDDSQRLQPMSGTFREWVLGPISAKDCDLLFEHFAGIQRKKSAKDPDEPYTYALTETGAAGDKRQVVYPVITFTAREFLKRVTDRMPYFMQVFLVHLYEHAQKQVLPVINRLWCERVFFDKVLPQLSEYLLGQWSSVPSDIQLEIEVALKECGMDGPTLLGSFGGRHSGSYPPDPEYYREQPCGNPRTALRFSSETFSARARTVLKQVGLTAGDSTIIAPLVAVWILERQGKGELP